MQRVFGKEIGNHQTRNRSLAQPAKTNLIISLNNSFKINKTNPTKQDVKP